MDAIAVESLTKIYRSSWPGKPSYVALSGLSLSVKGGEIYGFLGPNGAGKTTTLKILIGLMRPSGGRASVLGHPSGHVETHRRIGYLPETPYFYDYLTAEEFLGFYGSLAGLRGKELPRRISEMLETVGLSDARARQLRKFSKGMLQRIGLAQALIHDPELVILDEPMSGLDPIGRKQVRDIILGLRDRGKTVFFSSHILPDVEMMCDRVGILMNGKLVTEGKVDELVDQIHNHSFEVVFEGVGMECPPAIRAVASRIVQQGRRSMIVLSDDSSLEYVLAEISRQKGRLISVTPQKRSLEELFVKSPNEPELSDRKLSSCGV